MKKPNYTPGPWQRHGNSVFALTPYKGDSPRIAALCPDGVNRFSLRVSNDNNLATEEEIEAVARLACAAPQLAEALEICISQIKGIAGSNDVPDCAIKALLAAGYTE